MTDARSSDEAELRYHTEDAIGWITICNPARMNALTARMWDTLPTLLAQADADPSVRVIVLRGEGERAFSAGADISEFETARSGDSAETYDKLNDAAFSALTAAVKPTVAMIHGFCLGGGLAIAACCDLRFADEGIKVAIPAAKLGIGYNARWIPPLLGLTGPAHVKELLYTGRRFSAEDVERMGLVNQIVPPSDLYALVRSYADEICANAPLSVRAAKMCINEVWARPENPDKSALDEVVKLCFASADYVEGRRAFLEKRKPVFRGQ